MDDELRNENIGTTETIENTENDEVIGATADVSPMTDEEIRAAAENIGSTPYSRYENNYDRYSSYSSYDYSSSSDPYERKPEKPKKNFFAQAAKFVGLAACFGAVAGGAFFGVTSGLDRLMGEKSFLKAEEVLEDSTSAALKSLGVSNLVVAPTTVGATENTTGNAIVDVVKENMRSTVCVGVSYTATQRDIWGRTSSYEVTGGGSGFIVGMKDDEIFIATNNHVVEKAEKITITFSDDEEVVATVKATDPNNDLAIVAVNRKDVSADTLAEIKVATLGDSDKTEVGEMVIAIGNALGYGQSVTVGYLSAKDRKVSFENRDAYLLQTDAAINEGNSGGPLFNIKGEVVGINCAKYSDESVEGMCFAIPISAAIPILDELINREVLTEEEQGFLGVTITDVTSELTSRLGFPQGVLVQSVYEGGSAEKAGIYASDVITAVNGVTVTTGEQLKSKVNSYRIGTTVQITVKRLSNGAWEEKTIDVTLMKRPTE